MPDANSSGMDAPREAGGAGSVHTLLDPDRTRLVLSGEIDVALTDELTEAVTDAETAGLPVQGGARRVAVMDSAGSGAPARVADRTPGRVRPVQTPDSGRLTSE